MLWYLQRTHDYDLRLRFPPPTLANDKNAFLQLFLGISRGLGRFDSKFFPFQPTWQC